MITDADAARIAPALTNILNGACGRTMEPVVRSERSYDYLCPPSCGCHSVPVVATDDAVWDDLAAAQGWIDGYAIANRPKRRTITRRLVERVEVLPAGELSITYKSG